MEPTHGGPRWRLPVLTLLVAALQLVLLAVPAPPVRVADETPWCLWDPGIPVEAYRVEDFARTHNYWYSPDHYVTFRYMFPPQCLTLPVRRLFP